MKNHDHAALKSESLNPDGTCAVENEWERRRTAKKWLLTETDASPPRGYVGNFVNVNATSMVVQQAKLMTDENGQLVVMMHLAKAGG